MQLISNLVRARYRNQILFRPSNSNSAGGGLVRIRNHKKYPEHGEKPVESLES